MNASIDESLCKKERAAEKVCAVCQICVQTIETKTLIGHQKVEGGTSDHERGTCRPEPIALFGREVEERLISWRDIDAKSLRAICLESAFLSHTAFPSPCHE